MKNYKLHTSEGYRDIFGDEIKIKKILEERILQCFQSFGYSLIKTPAVEYIDIYSTNGLQKPDLYNLINRQGEVLALCNDMTSSITRFVYSNHFAPPLKYCYIADIFRYPRLYQGKQHQFLQAGVEYIAQDSVENDVECIHLANECLKACSTSAFTIHIGSAKFLNCLFEDLKISDSVTKKIYAAIEQKDYVWLSNMLHDNMNKKEADFIVDLMLRGGRVHYIENLMKYLKNGKSYMELQRLKTTYEFLKELGVENIIFDFSIYSYARYYTGIIFSIYIDGISKAVLEGGRCDELFNDFAVSYKNIGFGLDLDILTSYALNNNLIKMKEEKYLSVSDDVSFLFSCKSNDEFRQKGIIINHLSFKSLKEAKKYAAENKYDKIIEYKDNTYNLLEVEL